MQKGCLKKNFFFWNFIPIQPWYCGIDYVCYGAGPCDMFSMNTKLLFFRKVRTAGSLLVHYR